ncbi:MAG: hypothetical protein AB2551_03060 [Candidatus Thiodiazotropha sp.]
MNKSLINTLCLALFISGCGSDNDSDPSPLLGRWVTESCEQAKYEDGTPTNTWYRGYYEFTVFQTIQLEHSTYSDSNCTQFLDVTSPPDNNILAATYQDTGERQLQEGISGRGLTIELGEDERRIDVDAFYTINNGSLCFSDAFTFEALIFGVSETGSDNIDFEHCLTRP